MESHAVDYGDEQERPMRTAFSDCDRPRIVDREEDVRSAREVRECFFEGERIGSLHEHEGHGRAEENDVRGGEFGEFFAF